MIRPLAGLLCVPLLCGQATKPRLSLNPTPGSLQIELPREAAQAIRIVNSEEVYTLLYKRLAVARMSLATGRLDVIRLSPTPEMNALWSRILSDIDVDPNHRIHIPIVWEDAPRQLSAAVAVFNAAGEHQRTTKLVPAVNIRHLAVHPSGHLFVLGTDPGWFKVVTGRCLLIHEYSAEGQRIRSFSEATPLVLPPSAPTRPEDQFKSLFEEVDRGRLWIQDGLLYQLLPVSKIIRVFTVDGSLAGETTFLSPGTGLFRIWNAFPVGGGRYLVDWVREEGNATELRRTRGVALHDANGKPLTGLHGPADGLSLPIGCRQSADCVVVTRPAKSTRVLTRARLEVQ